MKDMAAVINANLAQGAGGAASQGTNEVFGNAKTGATAGMKINGKWVGGFDDKKGNTGAEVA
jgi:hypothetical protein